MAAVTDKLFINAQEVTDRDPLIRSLSDDETEPDEFTEPWTDTKELEMKLPDELLKLDPAVSWYEEDNPDPIIEPLTLQEPKLADPKEETVEPVLSVELTEQAPFKTRTKEVVLIFEPTENASLEDRRDPITQLSATEKNLLSKQPVLVKDSPT